MFVFKLVTLFVAVYVVSAACPIHTVSSQGAQQCLTVIGFLNHTVHSQAESCSVFQESMYCVQTYLHNQGLDCSITDVAASMYNTVLYKIFPDVGFNFSVCNVTEETSSLCTSGSRLSQMTLLACSPYLDIMQQTGGSMACAYAPNLMECAKQSMQYLDLTCTQQDLVSALKSQSATSLLSTQHAGLDLSQCFQTEPVSNSPCTNHMEIFSNQAVIQCMGVMPYVKITNPNDTIDTAIHCSVLQEVEACMVRQLQKTGTTCTMSQMYKVINTYIQMSPSDNVINQLGPINICPANDTYTTSSICDSDFRIVSFFSISAKDVLSSMEALTSMKDYVCTMLSSFAGTLFQPLGVKCSSSQIFEALTSSYGNATLMSHHPDLDVDHCLSLTG